MTSTIRFKPTVCTCDDVLLLTGCRAGVSPVSEASRSELLSTESAPLAPTAVDDGTGDGKFRDNGGTTAAADELDEGNVEDKSPKSPVRLLQEAQTYQ